MYRDAFRALHQRPWLPLLAALALALPLAVPAAGQSSGEAGFSRFEITPFLGYRLDGELDDVDLGFGFGSFEPEVDESEVYGLALGFGLNPNMQIELLWNQQDTDLTFERGLFEEEVVEDLSLTTVQVGFVYQWLLGQANPYVVAGAGITRIDLDVPGGDDDSRLSASLGGGVRLHFSRNVGLRLEGRLFATDLDSDFGDHDRHDDRFDRDRDDVLFQAEASAGLVFSF